MVTLSEGERGRNAGYRPGSYIKARVCSHATREDQHLVEIQIQVLPRPPVALFGTGLIYGRLGAGWDKLRPAAAPGLPFVVHESAVFGALCARRGTSFGKYDVAVLCINKKCRHHGFVFNVIMGLKSQRDQDDLVEGWPKSADEGDLCPECGKLGCPNL